MSRNINTTRLQQIIHPPPVHQYTLHLQIVEYENIGVETGVPLGLFEWIAGGVEGNEDVAYWPIFDVDVEDDVIAKVDYGEYFFIESG